jgi:hypothetical protein
MPKSQVPGLAVLGQCPVAAFSVNGLLVLDVFFITISHAPPRAVANSDKKDIEH